MSLLARLFFLFVAFPLLELAILIWVGTRIGVWPTIGIVLGTGALGAYLARLEGLRVWHRIQHDLATGRMPVAEVVDGLMIFLAGILLLTPGLLTDALGFALLVPRTRKAFRHAVGRRLRRMAETRSVSITMLLG